MLKYERSILTMGICLLYVMCVYGQTPGFQKAYNSGDAWMAATDFIAVSDGYVLTGLRDTTTTGPDHKPFLMKIDQNGNLLWLRYYGVGYQTGLNKVIPANDGGYLGVGTTRGFKTEGDGEILLIKTDVDGNLQWQKIIPSYSSVRRNTGDWVFPVAGGYIISGVSAKGDSHAVLTRINNQGNTIWSKRCFFEWGDNPRIREFFISGDTIFAAGLKDSVATFSLINAVNGSPMSVLTYKGLNAYENEFHSLAPASNGDWLLTGYTYTYLNEGILWACRIGRTGELRWAKSYPNVGPGVVSPLADGGFLIIPNKPHSNNSQLDPILIKIDAQGEVLWAHKYGLESSDAFSRAIETTDGGILAVGHVKLPGQFFADLLVVKTDANGQVSVCCEQPLNISAEPMPLSLSSNTMKQANFDATLNQNLSSESASLDILDYCPPVPDYVQIHLCPGDSVIIDGKAYNTPGLVTSLVPGTLCDTNLVYDIQAGVNPLIKDTVYFCYGSSVTLNGITYTLPGTYTQLLSDANGRCDTLATYVVEYTPPSGLTNVSIHCPSDTTVFIPQGADSVLVQYDAPVASTDCICPNFSLSQTLGKDSGSYFAPGDHNLCFRADDACDQSQTCCFTVSVKKDVLNDPCDVKKTGCIRFELLQVNKDADQHWIYYVRITNTCADAVKYVYFQTPKGMYAVEPVNQTGYTSPSGIAYAVRNPNFSPFYSIRFQPQGIALSGGQSDVFRYALPAQASVTYINAAVRLVSGMYIETHLNTFSCPVGTDAMPKPKEADTRSFLDHSYKEVLQVFPNPVGNEKVLMVRGMDTEGCILWLNDLTGRVHLEAPVANGQVNMEGVALPNGIYFFRVQRPTGELLGGGKVAVFR